VPAYKPKNKMSKVMKPYPTLKKLLWLFLAKYQGMAIILRPCEKPEMILAKNNNNNAFELALLLTI
jgi:hypothetical protein